MATPLQTLLELGITPDEAEQLLTFLQRWPRWYRQGLSALLQRNAVNRAGALVSSKDSKFDSPSFAYEMGKARAFAEVAVMLDDLRESVYGPNGGDE